MLYMKNKKAGERKRTVTITLGPRTLRLAEMIKARVDSAGDLKVEVEFTGVCAALFFSGLEHHAKLYGLTVEKDHIGSYN